MLNRQINYDFLGKVFKTRGTERDVYMIVLKRTRYKTQKKPLCDIDKKHIIHMYSITTYAFICIPFFI